MLLNSYGTSPTTNGNHINATSLRLAPASGDPKPQITSGGVVSVAACKATEPAAPGNWNEIFGSNLTSTTRVASADAAHMSAA
jgi:hypothetical protein